jgi:hypothetical protein
MAEVLHYFLQIVYLALWCAVGTIAFVKVGEVLWSVIKGGVK